MNRNVSVIARATALALALLLCPGRGQAADESPQPSPARPSAVPHPRGDGSTMYPMRRTTQADRNAAAQRLRERMEANKAAGIVQQKPAAKPAPAATGVKGAFLLLGRMALAQIGVADLYADPNYAVSKLPTASCRDATGVVVSPAVECWRDMDCTDDKVGIGLGYRPPIFLGPDQYPGGATCTGPVLSGGIRKFVDDLPVLCALGQTALGKCIPLAVPDRTIFPPSGQTAKADAGNDDYYELSVTEYTTRFHTDLASAAKQRGFLQTNTTDPYASTNQFLGPLILAKAYRPTRVTIKNDLPTGVAGNLFIPMDETLAGAGLGPDGTKFTENRIAVHLHGGNSPWISDGTQHQWTVPAGEVTSYKKGLAAAYVPDMWYDVNGDLITACAGSVTCGVAGASRNPGDGKLSFYWPNEQSGRLMFYHDHAYGITRLNVYAGVAAGYLLVQPDDEDALAAAGVPGTIGSLHFDPAYVAPPGAPTPTQADLTHMIPLVIQDRTFVPPASQLAFYDPTWDTAKWGGEDSVYLPHVYMPNQWLENPTANAFLSNPYGRWDYGPFFWPPQQSLVSLDGEPRALTIPCTSRAAVTATNLTGDTVCPNIPDPSTTPEAFMDTPVVNGVAYPKVTVDPVRYRFHILNAANDRNLNLTFFKAITIGQGVNSEVKMVQAIPGFRANYESYSGFSRTPDLCTEAESLDLSQVTGLPVGPDKPLRNCYPGTWPTDARQGGVPDAVNAGPRWIQIGTEGGILPKAARIAVKPTVFQMNKRSIVVLNVLDKSLFMGPAERADVVVDFSQYAGQTLILYNDAPAPVPAGDPRQDYYTWGPDMTDTGGSPTPLPGYGPNIRTVMQVTVRATPAGTGGNATPLDDVAVDVIDATLKERFKLSQLRPIIPESIFSQMYEPLTDYADTYLPVSVQNLKFTPIGSSMPVDMPFQWKALHELFTTDYGRMDSLLAVEIPATSWLVQTTIPYSNVDPATEFIEDNVPALWKITHNGVDTHTIHFHLINAQIINRVGWDGEIHPPDANELGWKEVVRMNPLEDIYIALQPVKQALPWPLPDMIRPLDVDRPLGTRTQFTGVDIYNQPINVANQLFNFGQEYVWHCHLLGHEEMDMLRAEVFVVAPEMPTGLVGYLTKGGTRANFSWTDASASAQFFTLQRDTDPNFGAPVSLRVAAPATQPGPVTYTDRGPLTVGTTYYYRLRAEKALSSPAVPGATWPAMSAWTATAQVDLAPYLELTPLSSAWGNLDVGLTGTTRDMKVANIGTATLTITSISLGGANAADFVIVANGCGATLAAGASCKVGVAFKPLTIGAKVATLTVSTDSILNPVQSVALGGTGQSGNLAVSPVSLTFGPQSLNSTSPGQVVTLRNTSATASIQSIALTFTGPFVRTTGANSCGTSLSPTRTCNVYVGFRPTTSGSQTGSLSVASTDPLGPYAVSLAGHGRYPAATGVTLAADTAQPALGGSVVTFTAAGSGAPAGTTYYYQFTVRTLAGATVTTQAWSTSATFAWTTPAVAYTRYNVIAEVTTNNVAPVLRDAQATVSYAVTAAGPVTAAGIAASPATSQARGATVTFTAAASGGPGPYTYLFEVRPGTTGAWATGQAASASNAWAWAIPATQARGNYQVRVTVSNGVTPDFVSTPITYGVR